MAGLDPAIHVIVSHVLGTWMPATSAGMTMGDSLCVLVGGDIAAHEKDT